MICKLRKYCGIIKVSGFRNALPVFIPMMCKFSTELNSTKYENSKTTVQELYETWERKFEQCGVTEPKESIGHILAHVLGSKKVTDVYINNDMVLKSHEIESVEKLCSKRLRKMPVQYIIQEWDFRDLTLKMSRPVFIPRPETEMLVDIVLKQIDETDTPIGNFLEFCCGSGAISLALLKSKAQLQGVAIDKSLKACKLAQENTDCHQLSQRLRIIQGEIEVIDEQQRFDLIVSNPPYIPSGDLAHLQPEITLYEDRGALDGGTDGLNIIKRILKVSSAVLKCGGKLYLEVDPKHPALIKEWLERNNNLGLSYLNSVKDFCEKERFVEIIKNN